MQLPDRSEQWIFGSIETLGEFAQRGHREVKLQLRIGGEEPVSWAVCSPLT